MVADTPSSTRVVTVESLRSQIKRFAYVAFNSATTFNVTGIPAWVKRITIFFLDVSWSAAVDQITQIGDAGGLETTVYTATGVRGGVTPNITAYTTGFGCESAAVIGTVRHGRMVLQEADAATNTWHMNGRYADDINNRDNHGSGSKSLSARLDRFTITTVAGTATWNQGSISYWFEG